MRDLLVILMMGIPFLLGYGKGRSSGYSDGYDKGFSAARKADR
jgi:hypothetical protein